MLPKLRQCENKEKLTEPFWATIEGSVSFLIGDVDGDGRNEALVSILDEPFAVSGHGTNAPRYLLRIFSTCDLMAHIEEVARYALNTPASPNEIEARGHHEA